MSSSPSRAREDASTGGSAGGAAGHRTLLPEVSPFHYDEMPAAVGRKLSGVSPPGSRPATDSSASAGQSAEREAQMRELGRQQGLFEAAKRFDEQLIRERAAIAIATAKFSRDCAAYYRRIEEEAVQLSLAIARKVLHREAQVDPLLLMGTVRVALDKIDGAKEVKLAVHPQRAADWRKHLASAMAGERLPEVVEDAALPLDQCELHTSMGTALLGIELQLKEIEQGLMDLLAARPPAQP